MSFCLPCRRREAELETALVEAEAGHAELAAALAASQHEAQAQAQAAEEARLELRVAQRQLQARPVDK